MKNNFFTVKWIKPLLMQMETEECETALNFVSMFQQIQQEMCHFWLTCIFAGM